MPVYLPRKKLLEYMLARVTRVDDIFKHVKFNTQVDWVEYDDDSGKFYVELTNLKTGATTEETYDKCVWAGGINSKPNYPQTVVKMLREGDYKGEAFHSSEIIDFDSSMQGKRIMLVGDSFSAEDLALQALKMGAERVYITSAAQSGGATETSTWPGNRVETWRCIPTSVVHNGTGLLCSEVKWDYYINGYAPVDEGYSVELNNIDAVIYCTGYRTDMTYVANELRYKCLKNDRKVPKDWISQRNSLTRDLGNVKPDVELGSVYVCDNIYRHVLIENPNMMYIYTITPYYLPEIDAIAWALASYVTGNSVLPSKVEMLTRNYLEKIDELNVPYLRESMDEEYERAVENLKGNGHWIQRLKRNRKAGFD